MSDFSIGSGEKYLAAKALPTGTKVRIVSMEPKQSKITRKEGEETWQVCVVFEALEAGTTVPYEKGRTGSRVTVAAQDYEAGTRFSHYYGGIYPKSGGGYRISDKAGTFAFLNTLKELGVPLTGKWADYVGLVISLERARGVGAQGTYYTPLPNAVHGRAEPASEEGAGDAPAPTPPPQDSEPPKAAPKAKRPSFKKTAPKPADNAFLALSQEDKDAVLEYTKECGGSGLAEPEALVGVVARDLDHAKAILAGVP